MDPVAAKIAQLIEEKGYSYSGFAEAIGVQRTIISHILSGRNRPSLDIVQRILRTFPELDGEALVLGEETAARKMGDEPPPKYGAKGEDEPTGKESDGKSPNKRIERVVICYDDGSFAAYEADA